MLVSGSVICILNEWWHHLNSDAVIFFYSPGLFGPSSRWLKGLNRQIDLVLCSFLELFNAMFHRSEVRNNINIHGIYTSILYMVIYYIRLYAIYMTIYIYIGALVIYTYQHTHIYTYIYTHQTICVLVCSMHI